ncbi:MAG: RNA polymerase sigma factor [Planctomycetota bacterium]
MSSGNRELLEFLDKSGAELYALLTRLTLREDVAEELMQELFIKLSRSSGPNKVANWNAYARRAAINLAFDWRRGRKRVALQLGQVPEPIAGNTSPLGKLIHSEETQETLNAIGRLKKTAREALVMRYIQQESYDDIARQMGKTSHQIRAMCARSMAHLRDMLGSNHRKSPLKGDKECLK